MMPRRGVIENTACAFARGDRRPATPSRSTCKSPPTARPWCTTTTLSAGLPKAWRRLAAMTAADLKRVAVQATRRPHDDAWRLVRSRRRPRHAAARTQKPLRRRPPAGRARRRGSGAYTARSPRCRSTRSRFRRLREHSARPARAASSPSGTTTHEEWKRLDRSETAWARFLRTRSRTRPHFVAYASTDLPAAGAVACAHAFGLPLLTWTVRTRRTTAPAERYADQMIFEGFRAVSISKADTLSRARTRQLRMPRSLTLPRSATSAISRRGWDACANPRIPAAFHVSASYNPFISHAFLSALETLRSATGAHRLAAAASAGRSADGTSPRRRALLPQIPLARRIRVRSRLGGSL